MSTIKTFEEIRAGDVIVGYQPRKRARWVSVRPSIIDVLGPCEERTKSWGKKVKFVQIRGSYQDEYIAEGEKFKVSLRDTLRDSTNAFGPNSR